MGLLPTLLIASSLTLAYDDLRVVDIDGNKHDFDGQTTVFVFVKTGCPIANYYHPTMRRLADSWGDRVTLVMVHTEAAKSREEIQTHRKEYEVAGIVLQDQQNQLVNKFGATITPEAVLIDATGAIRYRGRIDDTYLGFGRRRQSPTAHDLRNAVDAVLKGQPVVPDRTKAVGCLIRKRAT